MRLARSSPAAPWLPPGSTAEFWVGADVEVPEPTVIVRLALVRGRELFCVRTAKGFDLPAVFLGTGEQRRPASAGIADLTLQYLGAEAATRCVGFVRNVVPVPDESYHLPAPLAHVPVFTPRDPALVPLGGAGTWIRPAEAPRLLSERHWWTVVREGLGWPADPEVTVA
jgi:hypothetical protein